MRRVLALIAAIVLVASLASVSLAAGPTARVNRFAGNFDMLYGGEVVARVVVNFKEPTSTQMVPGTLDVYWTPGWGYPDNAAAFPFMDLKWYPVRESHAQLIAGFFGHDADAGGLVAGVSGYLCDYTVEWNGDCRDFSAIFVRSDDPAMGNRAAWAFNPVMNPEGEKVYDYASWFDAGTGSFSLIYAGPTGT